MNKLRSYMDDGACAQSQAVLALFRDVEIESSWNKDTKEYDAEFIVGRWENCREQGYVFSLFKKDRTNQLNIAVFEHRNTDSLCAVTFEAFTTNTPCLADVPQDVYKDKYDVSFTADYMDIKGMVEYLEKTFIAFWLED